MPLQALAVSTVLNIGLDLIFVPVLHWGVAGVAIATAIAITPSAPLRSFIRLLKTDSVVRVTLPRPGYRPRRPSSAASSRSARPLEHPKRRLFAVANIIIQSAINSLGSRSWRHRAPP